MDPFTAQATASALGTGLGYFADQQARNNQNHENRQLNAKNIAMQKEFAQNGIRWKIEDAKRAGIAPVAALGASGTSYSPASIGMQSDTSKGDSLRQMGQDVGRAIGAAQTQAERQFTDQMRVEQLRGARLQNKLLEGQIIGLNGPTNPPLPSPMDNHLIPGQGNAVKVKPAEVYASQSGQPGVQAGAINSMQYARTAEGNLTVVPSTDMKERIEDDVIGETGWHLKNRLLPPPPSDKLFPAPKGHYWRWNPISQEFEASPKSSTWYDDYSKRAHKLFDKMLYPISKKWR